MSHFLDANDQPSIYDPSYYLASTNDTTDRTEEIEKILREHRMCLLGKGVFYVSGVKMPDNTALRGIGSGTRLILNADVAAGFTVKMSSFCCVKDLCIAGCEESIELPQTVGERHGILFAGNATTKLWTGQPRNSIIEACCISSFTGGGITCVDTGYHICSSLTASNCHILNCGACINISHFSEYHEFTNMLCSESLYGCINNGGNNVFVNCGFNSNITGFVIDNSGGQSCNNSHGSAIGCTFNHSDGNKGIGIRIMGASHGYVFSGCQVFYSKIIVEASSAIVFDAFNFGKNSEIEVTGGRLVMFTGCAFGNTPAVRVTDNEAVKFLNCYTRDGEEVRI